MNKISEGADLSVQFKNDYHLNLSLPVTIDNGLMSYHTFAVNKSETDNIEVSKGAKGPAIINASS